MNMRRYIAGPIVAAALLVAGPAMAADKSDQLVEAMKLDDALESTFAGLVPLFGSQVLAEMERQPGTRTMVAEFAARGPGGRERMEAILAEEFMIELRRHFPQIKAELARTYRAKLSDAELDAVLQFLGSSAGAKFITAQQDVESAMQETGEKIGAKAAMAAMPRAFERIEAELAR